MDATVLLLIYVFGRESMRATTPDIKSCQRELVSRERELDKLYDKIPVGTGMELGARDASGRLVPGRVVLRGDITMECKIEDKAPKLRGPLG